MDQSISTPRSQVGHQRFATAVYFFGALGELMFGYDLGVIGVALLFISKDFQLTAFEQGLVVSSLLAGAAIGVGAAGLLADRYGRRPVIIVMAAVFTGGGLAGALAPTAGALIVARLIMGLGVGASAVVVMIYLAEMAPTEHRGRITALGQLMVAFGILLSYIVDYLLSPWAAWRWMIGLSAAPSVLLLIGMFFMPESPRWLIRAGRSDAAKKVLVWMGRGATAEAETLAIETALAAEVGGRPTLREWLRSLAAPRLRRTLLVCCGLAVAVQLLGINTIIYYAPTILIQVGFGTQSAIIANVGTGTMFVLATLAALGVIDRFGRRRLLLGGTVGMTLGMFVLSLICAFAEKGGSFAGWVTISAMLVFLGSFAASWGVCTRVMIAELLPQNVRGATMGLILVLNWMANFCVGLFFPIMLKAFGLPMTFMIFSGVGVLAFVFVSRWVPETAGRSLEEIERDLGVVQN